MAEAQVQDQAFVTLATNDSYGLGALTLGYSLRRVGTTRSLVCMVTNEISPSIRDELANLYVLVEVNILDSHDTVNLALLTRPDLGVTFTKLHCWRLTQYSKCVFMDADTLVLQNIDDLFEREELSAASDIGWPDCFNSGVFVFKPSQETYDRLLQLALTRGSFDGGDQGLLNAFFSDWSTSDIKFHLPFLYNVVAQAFYTYKPAFKRFGKDAKVIHFIGPHKPWHGIYHPETGSVDCPGDLGLNCQEFVKLWWEIFIQNASLSKNYLKEERAAAPAPAEESFPEVIERHQLRWEKGDADYLGVDKYENVQKRLEIKSGIVHVPPPVVVAVAEDTTHKDQALKSIIKQMPIPELSASAAGPQPIPSKMEVREISKPRHKVPREEVLQRHPVVHDVVVEPRGSDDVDRRYKWEMGQVDYLGKDSFENIMKRLDEKTKKSDQKFERPVSNIFPMPAPTYKPAAEQFAKLSDTSPPVKQDVSLKGDILKHSDEEKAVVSGTFKMQSSTPLTTEVKQDVKLRSDALKHSDKEKAVVSGTFKVQSSAQLTTEDLPSKTETSDKVNLDKDMKSGSFVPQVSSGMIAPLKQETESRQEQVMNTQKTREQNLPPAAVEKSVSKPVSDYRDLSLPSEVQKPDLHSTGSQEIRERLPGRYTFQSTGEQTHHQPVKEVVSKKESSVSKHDKRKVDAGLPKPGRSDSEKIDEQRLATHVMQSQTEGNVAESESWFNESFNPAMSIENFSSTICVKRVSFKADVFDVKQTKGSYSLRSAHPQTYAQTVKVTSSSPLSSRLVSGAKSITVVTKARSDKK